MQLREWLGDKQVKGLTSLPQIKITFKEVENQRQKFKDTTSLFDFYSTIPDLLAKAPKNCNVFFLNQDHILGYYNLPNIVDEKFTQEVRNIFAIALSSNTDSIVVSQIRQKENHLPSETDIDINYKLLDMCCLFNIELVDSVFIREDNHRVVSMKEYGFFEEKFILEWLQTHIDKHIPLNHLFELRARQTNFNEYTAKDEEDGLPF